LSKVVVTGASGFIGGYVCRELLGRGVDVIAVGHRRLPNVPGADCVLFDDLPGGLAESHGTCIHLAGENLAKFGSGEVSQRLKESLELNRQILTRGFKRIVFSSSAAVYGDFSPKPHSEIDPVNPLTPYAKVKVASESYFTGGHVVARLCNVYGLNMAASNVVSRVLEQARGEGALRLHNQRPIRDFVHVTDAARALADLALADCSGIFNIGSGGGTRISELVQIILELAGDSGRAVVEEYPSTKESTLILNVDKMRATLGWKARVSLREGLCELVEQKKR
jgi:UDP-glucose 4-epimerase